MSTKPVEILFREQEQTSLKMQRGTMTLEELYSTGPVCWVSNAAGDQRMINRRDFNIVDFTYADRKEKRKCVVFDIDGVFNIIPKKIDGTAHRERVLLEDGETIQWTEISKTPYAEPVKHMFAMVDMYWQQGYEIIFLTARGDSQRIDTETFLNMYLKRETRYSLFMRGVTCNDMPAPDLKVIQMQCCIMPHYDVELFVDDTQANIEKMRAVFPELKCLHVIS